MEVLSPVGAALFQALWAMGLDHAFARYHAERYGALDTVEEAFEKVRDGLRSQLCHGHNSLLSFGGTFALLGATGVGKTTTIAKLAARFSLQHGPESVGLLTTDCYRVAAEEQLKTYGRLLGINVAVVENAREMQQALHVLRHKKLILIDTPGLVTAMNDGPNY